MRQPDRDRYHSYVERSQEVPRQRNTRTRDGGDAPSVDWWESGVRVSVQSTDRIAYRYWVIAGC